MPAQRECRTKINDISRIYSIFDTSNPVLFIEQTALHVGSWPFARSICCSFRDNRVRAPLRGSRTDRNRSASCFGRLEWAPKRTKTVRRLRARLCTRTNFVFASFPFVCDPYVPVRLRTRVEIESPQKQTRSFTGTGSESSARGRRDTGASHKMNMSQRLNR